MSDVCENHYKTIEDLAVIKSDISHIRERIDNEVECFRRHIFEGEKEGGVRDRVYKTETRLDNLERHLWTRIIVGGVIGGFVASGSPELIKLVISLVIR